MNSIQRQGELLEKLANILFNTTNLKYDELQAVYKVHHDFGTIGTSLYRKTDNRTLNFEAPTGVASKNLDLCEELRSLMKKHTGGEWDSFTLTLDADGKATTKFVYPDKD